jgi:hypothetical protein
MICNFQFIIYFAQVRTQELHKHSNSFGLNRVFLLANMRFIQSPTWFSYNFLLSNKPFYPYFSQFFSFI